jgi:hypothetical protein
MNSQTLIKQTNSKLGVRVRLWKNAPGTLLTPTLSINNAKAVFTAPEWIRKVSVRFSAVPTIFNIEVSDTGAFSLIKANVSIGATSVTVVDTTGWSIGTKIIFRSSRDNDVHTITNVVGDTIYFDGQLQDNYDTTETVEDDRWYKVATSRCDANAVWVNLGESVDDHPMRTNYGQYWRIGPVTKQINVLSDFRLYPDTYYDLTPYLAGPVEYTQRADLKTGDSPLSTCSIRLHNVDDRFNRRNLSNPYIDGTVNYMKRPNRVTVEWIAQGPDWEQATVGGVADWRLLCTFDARKCSVARDEFSDVVMEGETLSQLRYSVDVPLTEVTTIKDLMSEYILMQEHREALAEGADDGIKHRVAVLETGELGRTNTEFQEIIGRGDFGNCTPFYTESGEESPNEEQSPILYAGFYGITTDGKFLYTCHSMEQPEGSEQRGMYIVKRFMSGVPVDTKDIFLFYESDTTDIEEGDIVMVGDTMWLHTAQQNVTNNVFKIDFSDADNPSVSASYAAKGGAGHLPVHAATDGTFLYVLYDGGAEGRTLYKVNAGTYATIWSYQFSAPQNVILDGGIISRPGGKSGLVIIGSSTLLVFSRRILSSGKIDSYIAVKYTLSDSPTYVTGGTAGDVINFITKIHPDESMNNTYGWASVVQTSAGLLALTGGAEAHRGQSQVGGSTDSSLWKFRGGAISKIATIRFFAQNGNIINNEDAYTDPRAQKDSANYDLEEIWVAGELQDNSGTYLYTTKTTDDYEINLLTGEVLFLTPPEFGEEVKISYDHKPSVQFFQADNIPRWQTIRELAQVANGIAYTTKNGRVAVKLRRGQEDHVLTSASGETIQLRGRNIIHTSNTAYDFNSLQVANADHNFFYVEGTHYNLSYNAGTGVYTLTEVGTSLEGHIVITYIQGPSDDALVLFDDDGSENPPTMLSADESWSFADLYNSIIVAGERAYPLDTPITYIETYAISPQQLNVDTTFSKVQKAEAQAQYDWDGDRKIFLTEEKQNVSGSGFVVEFQDPLIIGTTKWLLREPDTSHVEEKTATEAGATGFQRVTWDTDFLEPGSSVETTNYDVLVVNKSYWRVCTLADESDDAWIGGSYKTGSDVVLKKFRDGGVPSDTCVAYAYATKDTSFYIDAAGIIQEAEITDALNPTQTASPDKSIYIRIGATDERGAHLFRQAGTYDSVSIAADYAVFVGAVRIGYDGISVDVNNYASIEHFLQVLVVGFPISGLERVKVICEDMITLDGSLSSVDEMGERNMQLDNRFIQSVGIARTVGYGLLDWLKTEHSEVPVRDKFNDEVSILEPCLVRANYGNFDEELELWLVSAIHYSLVKGDSGMSSTTYSLVDMNSSPSAPPAGS